MEFFKSVCKFKGDDGRFGIGIVDTEGNKSIELFNGITLPSRLIEFDGRRIIAGSVYKIYEATCGGENCKVGIPKQACVDNGTYSPRKCAVYSLNVIDPETFDFRFTYKELQIFKLN